MIRDKTNYQETKKFDPNLTPTQHNLLTWNWENETFIANKNA